MAAIHVISPSEFKQNQKKFFDLALSERVVIKRGKDLFELVSKPYIRCGVFDHKFIYHAADMVLLAELLGRKTVLSKSR